MQGSVRAVKAVPKLHNYNSARDKTMMHKEHTHIMHIKNYKQTHTLKLT